MIWSLLRLRSARREFAQRPAFAQWHVWAALPNAETLRIALREDGIDTRQVVESLHALEEAAEYAQAALDGRAWDAAAVEIDDALSALGKIELATGPPSPMRIRSIPRRPLAQTVNGLLFSNDGDSLAAGRRLDVALLQLAKARVSLGRTSEVAWWGARKSIEEIASPQWLRPYVRRAISGTNRDTMAEVGRLLDEAQEAADFAVAALDQRAWESVPIDLDRLDAGLRALRHIIQRESPVYLPEPWPLRLPARIITARIMRKEAVVRARKRWEEMQPWLESFKARYVDRDAS